MALSIGEVQTMQIPLRIEDGAERIGKTRVPIDTVIGEYNAGTRPEKIVTSFPSLELADVYLVIGYYLKHRQEVDQYLAKNEREEKQIEQWVRSWSKQPTRQELLARKRSKKNSKD